MRKPNWIIKPQGLVGSKNTWPRNAFAILRYEFDHLRLIDLTQFYDLNEETRASSRSERFGDVHCTSEAILYLHKSCHHMARAITSTVMWTLCCMAMFTSITCASKIHGCSTYGRSDIPQPPTRLHWAMACIAKRKPSVARIRDTR